MFAGCSSVPIQKAKDFGHLQSSLYVWYVCIYIYICDIYIYIYVICIYIIYTFISIQWIIPFAATWCMIPSYSGITQTHQLQKLQGHLPSFRSSTAPSKSPGLYAWKPWTCHPAPLTIRAWSGQQWLARLRQQTGIATLGVHVQELGHSSHRGDQQWSCERCSLRKIPLNLSWPCRVFLTEKLSLNWGILKIGRWIPTMHTQSHSTSHFADSPPHLAETSVSLG